MKDNNVDLSTLRHSFSHLMAAAVLSFFPQAQIAIGPSIENGFYYDFELPRTINDDDLELISERMKILLKEDSPVIHKVVSRSEAKKIFKEQKYKLELVDSISEKEDISIYTIAGFTDLCRGPHVKNLSELNKDSFALLSIAGSYWRGDENNKMLTRIYGTAFKKEKDLKEYLNYLEEVKKRDHRKLGVQLDLFSLHEEAGPGLCYWHPMGARIRNQIEMFWKKEHYDNGYELVYTPHVGKSTLWQTSGHLDFYKESMYSPMQMDKCDYYVKPMNCPFAIMIYKNSKHSYRELPFRWAELGTVYRYEKLGSLHGLLRVRGFTQDDAHIFCAPKDMEDEILKALRFALHILRSFGFEKIKAYLSTRPEKSVGDLKLWESAENSLRKALEMEKIEYKIDEGGGAFYGPKIDVRVCDALSREWQLSTIQFDFNLPERFKLTYVDSDGVEKRPLMIHRALLGSIERFFGILIEHYAGNFPLWLSPVQAIVVPISQKNDDYAKKVCSILKKNDIRVNCDLRDERMNAKIRDASEKKIPYTIIVGDKEEKEETVSVRYFGSKKQENGVAVSSLVSKMRDIIDNKKTNININ